MQYFLNTFCNSKWLECCPKILHSLIRKSNLIKSKMNILNLYAVLKNWNVVHFHTKEKSDSRQYGNPVDTFQDHRTATTPHQWGNCSFCSKKIFLRMEFLAASSWFWIQEFFLSIDRAPKNPVHSAIHLPDIGAELVRKSISLVSGSFSPQPASVPLMKRR